MDWAQASNDASREIAGTLHPEPEERYAFFCECGCRHRVELRLSDFDERRAAGEPILQEGHFKPLPQSGPPLGV
ncbi:MAG: hypothetical protein ACREX8_01955 [Gammaproteobacteria bacterium]